jgi:hypothetical protein
MKTALKNQAIILRKKGYFYSEIAAKLGVSKSSAHLWTSSIALTDARQKLIESKLHAAKRNNATRLALTNRQRRDAQDEVIRAEARQIVHNLSLDSVHRKLLCAVLLWCEGGKTTSDVRFINSDPAMVKTFLDLFRASFSLDESKFRALLHVHEYHDQHARLLYWSEVTNIPLSQFHRPYVKPHTGKNTHNGYPGCISIRYHDSTLGKMLKMIYTEFGKI